ncbi:MAG: hypothetical protein LKK35_02090, partial [Olsenella sp.]|nr:hypothetical protein [Olsenella sp.]
AEQNPWSDAGALRALRLLAKKHGGALQATSENGVATLRASVPTGAGARTAFAARSTAVTGSAPQAPK